MIAAPLSHVLILGALLSMAFMGFAGLGAE